MLCFCFQWLNENQIVQRLVDCIVPSNDEDVSNICTLFKYSFKGVVEIQELTGSLSIFHICMIVHYIFILPATGHGMLADRSVGFGPSGVGFFMA